MNCWAADSRESSPRWIAWQNVSSNPEYIQMAQYFLGLAQARSGQIGDAAIAMSKASKGVRNALAKAAGANEDALGDSDGRRWSVDASASFGHNDNVTASGTRGLVAVGTLLVETNPRRRSTQSF